MYGQQVGVCQLWSVYAKGCHAGDFGLPDPGDAPCLLLV